MTQSKVLSFGKAIEKSFFSLLFAHLLNKIFTFGKENKLSLLSLNQIFCTFATTCHFSTPIVSFMRRNIVIALLAALLLSACEPKGDNGRQAQQPIDTIPVMVMQIKKCSRLYTTEVKVHKIITHSDQLKLKGSILAKTFNIQLPIGDRKVAIPMDATLKAYVDFGNFSEHNIRRNGRKIEIILPDPQVELTSSKIDHENVMKSVSIFRTRFTDAEMTNYERQGRASIINSIPELGIIDNAKHSAATTIIPMVKQLGFAEHDITITFRKDFDVQEVPLSLYKMIEKIN